MRGKRQVYRPTKSTENITNSVVIGNCLTNCSNLNNMLKYCNIHFKKEKKKMHALFGI
jgi:hypothetical protein